MGKSAAISSGACCRGRGQHSAGADRHLPCSPHVLVGRDVIRDAWLDGGDAEVRDPVRAWQSAAWAILPVGDVRGGGKTEEERAEDGD